LPLKIQQKWMMVSGINQMGSHTMDDDSSYRLNFDQGKKNKITTARKSMLKLVKLRSLVAECCKMRELI
jgi:hypothetical protein